MIQAKNTSTEQLPPRPAHDCRKLHVVAVPKLLLMTVLSLGTYTHYWYYRNWLLYRGQQGFKWIPLLCSIACHLLIYPLAKRIEKEYESTGSADGFSALRVSLMFWLPYVLLLGWIICFPERWVSVLPNSIVFVIPIALSVVCWIMPLVAVAQIQQTINTLAGDELGRSNAQVTGMNRLWLYISWLPLFLLADYFVKLSDYLI